LGGFAIASAQVAAGIPEIAQQVIYLVDPPRIATFLFAPLDPIHGAKGHRTSFFWGQTSRDFSTRCSIWNWNSSSSRSTRFRWN